MTCSVGNFADWSALMIKEYSNLFINLSFNNRKYLNIFSDPTTNPVPPAKENSSRNSSLERHHRKNHDHIKPPADADASDVL